MRVWYITCFVMLVMELVLLTCLFLWVYRSTKDWGLAFAATSSEWPIRNMDLKRKLSAGQTFLLRITAYLGGAIIFSVAATAAIILAFQIWRH